VFNVDVTDDVRLSEDREGTPDPYTLISRNSLELECWLITVKGSAFMIGSW